MFHKIVTYVLLLNFVNTMFFHQLYLPASYPSSLYDQQDPESDEVDSLLDLLAELWLEFSGKTPFRNFQEKPDHSSFEKEFLRTVEQPELAKIPLPKLPPLGHLPPLLLDQYPEIISPPPKPAPSST